MVERDRVCLEGISGDMSDDAGETHATDVLHEGIVYSEEVGRDETDDTKTHD